MLFSKLPNRPKGVDKLEHAMFCFTITALVGVVAGPAAGIAVGASLGVGKELLDKKNGKVISKGDLAADGIGTAIAALVLWLAPMAV